MAMHSEKPVVIVADDDPAIINILRAVLGQDIPDADLEYCEDTDDLDSALRRHGKRVKALLTDSRLGSKSGTTGGSGADVLKDLRAGKYGEDLRDVSAIFMSGEPDNTFDHDPHVAYLAKPFGIEEITPLVRAALDHKDMEHDPEEGQRARDHAGRVLISAFKDREVEYVTDDFMSPVELERPGADLGKVGAFVNHRVKIIRDYTEQAFHEGAPSPKVMAELVVAMEQNERGEAGYLYLNDDRQYFQLSMAMNELKAQIRVHSAAIRKA